MKYIADFHIHSHFSIATSKNLIPEYLDYWARLKGITVVGTGDFTHPGWVKELKEKLEPAEHGLFKLKEEYLRKSEEKTVWPSDTMVRFILTSEISSIYKKNEKTRKVHNVIFAPDFAVVDKIQRALTRIGGNITSDGRPILGLDSRDLLEIALQASENIFFVPAHIWTPWFSALGAKSGFDSIDECYDDLAQYIYAVETGLSSDPAMNWACSILDNYTLISNSDAHSPEKLGREANIFNTDLSYDSITQTLKSGDPEQFLGTIEFFPQEGKYHYDGHRKCNIRWDPVETLRNNMICSVCNKMVTVGVMNRVINLSDREDIQERNNRHPFYSVIPLKEILSEIYGIGPNSKKINSIYLSLLENIGSEFDILLNLPIDDIKSRGDDILAEAIQRMRNREVIIKEGFDGEFGVIKVFGPGDLKAFSSQASLFDNGLQKTQVKVGQRKLINFDLDEYRRLEKNQAHTKVVKKVAETDRSSYYSDVLKGLNSQQRKAAMHGTGPALVLAGPGTGKTRVLTCRIADLIVKGNVLPENILAVTFTNKAAGEMKGRLKNLIDKKSVIDSITISTFHAFGHSILKELYHKTGRNNSFSIISEDEKRYILQEKNIGDKKKVRELAEAIIDIKQNLKTVEKIDDHDLARHFSKYERNLREQNAFDLDDLIYQTAILLLNNPEVRKRLQDRYSWILIDEYQDINYAQYSLIQQICKDGPVNLFAIGDQNQAIYGFRGADVSFIKTFTDDFPEAVVYRLKKSYRCSDKILKASDQVIQHGSIENEGLEGLCKGVKITISSQKTDKSEAEFIARRIEDMIGGLRSFSMASEVTDGESESAITSLSDFAVLCRINRQIGAIEKAFNDHSVPYQIVGEKPLFKKEPVRSILNVLKLSENPVNSLLQELLISKAFLSRSKVTDLLDLVRDKKKVTEKLTTIERLIFNDLKIEEKSQCKELHEISKGFGENTEQFIVFTDLGASVDTYRPETETVTIMTLHASKGLEFPCVFIAGCEDGLLPYSLIKSQKTDYEEEKRLLYVGMTRAKRHLILSHAEKRFIFGRELYLERSPFLNTIEDELIKFAKTEYRQKEKEKSVQLNLFQ